jgi:ribose 5-phosphate isomerase
VIVSAVFGLAVSACFICTEMSGHRLMANDAEKELAARAALEYIHDRQVVGLGSGSTSTIAIHLIGKRVRQGLKIRGVPTSIASRELANH